MKNRRLALIDGDIVVYRIGYASQDNKHSIIDRAGDVLAVFDGKVEANDYCELMSISGNLKPRIDTEIIPKGHDEVDMMINIMIKNILDGAKANEYQVYLTGKTNFRNDLAVTQGYKENRTSKGKPVHYNYIREFIEENHPTLISQNCEADDMMAYRQYPSFCKSKASKRKKDCDTIICTIDKDLRTVPGYHYHITKQTIDWVTPRAANRFFAEQMLTGDGVDNIPGLSRLSEGKVRIGPKKAQNIIEGCNSIKSLHRAVSRAYAENVPGDWKAKLQEVGSLLWMQREVDQMFYYDKWSEGKYE